MEYLIICSIKGFTLLTNEVSRRINDLTDAVAGSDLPDSDGIRRKIVAAYTPECLLELVGVDGMIERLPDNYLRSIVATKIATSFVYDCGLDADEVVFFNYVSGLKGE